MLVGLVIAGSLGIGAYWYFSSPSAGWRELKEPDREQAATGGGGSQSALVGQTGRGATGVGVAAGPGAGEATTKGSGAAAALGALKPRAGAVGEPVGSEAEGAGVQVEGVAPANDKLAALKPQRGTVEQSTTMGASAPGEAEVPPEVVFEGGKDKRFVTETQVQLEEAGKIAGDAGTMAFWLKPDWEPSDQNDAVFVQLGEGQQAIRVAKNVNFLRFEFFDAEGRERGVGVPLDDWKPGEWHQVSATWVQGRLALFVDGKPVSQNSFDVVPVLGDEPKAYVGSKLPSGSPAPGEMADVRILNRPLQPNEIQELAQQQNRPQ